MSVASLEAIRSFLKGADTKSNELPCVVTVIHNL